MFEVTGFRCECGAAIDCTYPNCNEGIEMGKKDIIERLQDYAKDYTTTTYHDDLIQEAVTEIESLRQQLEQAYADIAGLHDQLEETQIAQDDYRLNKLELEQLRQQLDAKEAEVDDLGDDLAQVKRQLAKRDKQVMLLHFELFNSAEYIDTLGGTSLEARKTLAATEQWK